MVSSVSMMLPTHKKVHTMAYVVSIDAPEGRKLSRSFATHKSARGFARRCIREGADLVRIHFRPSSVEDASQDALKNVYLAEVDTVNHVRRHVRVSVDAWREMLAKGAAIAKAAKAERK